MTLEERLFNDMKAALKEREAGKRRLSVIRLARAALKNQAIALERPLTEEEVVMVLAREVKERREAIEEYTRLGRQEAVTELQEEISVLEAYLPQQLSRDEIEESARRAIADTKAAGLGDIGKVMRTLMPKMKGRANGRIVQEIVRTLLSEEKQ